MIRIHVDHICDGTVFNKSWLRTCTNESVLVEMLRQHANNCMSPLFSNPHPLVVSYIFNLPEHMRQHFQLSANPADAIVDWLMEHPNIIDWDELYTNPNPRVAHLITAALDRQDARVSLARVASIETHSHLIEYLWRAHNNYLFTLRGWRANDNELAVEIQLKELRQSRYTNQQRFEELITKFAGSRHDRAVQYYVQYHSSHPDMRVHDELWSNTNDYAVEYALGLPKKMHILLCRNPHPDVVAYYDAHPDLICWPTFLANSHPTAVERSKTWLIEHASSFPSRYVNDLLDNRNMEMCEFVLTHPRLRMQIPMHFHAEWVFNCNPNAEIELVK